ncbi:hypothetical protein TEA_024575 [Camellia sinensis var. sinensis]|uniref:Nucleoside diphosphate kinase n=1 Tax=Camellia sinensis var. sinensis TaxID=542762 RepID=A0A4V3WN00_CAMSN|nr:hypothetical protein TEA_024575 [Camellia sinensis var. sinensis]
MVWEGKDVVASGRKIIGATNPSESAPGTIRGDFAVEIGRNVIHGSDSVESARKEIALWFPDGTVNWQKQKKHGRCCCDVVLPVAAATVAWSASTVTFTKADGNGLCGLWFGSYGASLKKKRAGSLLKNKSVESVLVSERESLRIQLYPLILERESLCEEDFDSEREAIGDPLDVG